MAPLSKGKEKVIDGYGSESAGKRKRNNAGNDAVRKRNRSVLQFFEDAADVGDDDCSDDSLFGGIIFFLFFVGVSSYIFAWRVLFIYLLIGNVGERRAFFWVRCFGGFVLVFDIAWQFASVYSVLHLYSDSLVVFCQK